MSAQPTKPLREDAVAIWRAGVDAVDSQRLTRHSITASNKQLIIGQTAISREGIRSIRIVGAGKAGAGMAAGAEAALLDAGFDERQISGWINVPADCVRNLQLVHLHAARSPGVNEPTEQGVAGARKIIELVSTANESDLVIALISGGGSALMPLPRAGISWQDKVAVTRFMSAAGADIRQLNTVRKQLSGIKGGQLAHRCQAGTLVTLILSDVLGDPLDIIASGPTVPNPTTAGDAIEILKTLNADATSIPKSVWMLLESKSAAKTKREFPPNVFNHIIGNLSTAIQAAANEAKRRGYQVTIDPIDNCEPTADEVGQQLAKRILALRAQEGQRCLIQGGEPTVRLVEESKRGLGGRNQQLVLAALCYLREAGLENFADAALLSGGTDGEDGPTDAAGAVLDETLFYVAANESPNSFLVRNDAYSFFSQYGGLLKTGPTHTNVCDLRVVVSNG